MDVRRLKPSLDSLLHPDDKWNFDLEDCDHILRVETLSVSAFTIIAAMEQAGYACTELEDFIEVKLSVKNSDGRYTPQMKATAG